MKETRDGDDHHHHHLIRFLQIEFLGGPYDGHKEPGCTLPAHLPADVVWLVCEDVFRLLDGKDHRPGGSITSVAIYELDAGNGAVRYRFAGASSVKELTHSERETPTCMTNGAGVF